MGGPASVGGRYLSSTDNFLKAPFRFPCVIVEADGSEHEEEVEWETCEHLFQAMKFDSINGGTKTWNHCRKIQEVQGAMEAWSLGQSRKCPLRKDWNEMKGHAMYLAVKAKYDQYPEYDSELVNTTAPIKAKRSTSNWQELNSIVLERVRFELSMVSSSKVDESSLEYKSWCRATSLSTKSNPVTVYLFPASAAAVEKPVAKKRRRWKLCSKGLDEMLRSFRSIISRCYSTKEQNFYVKRKNPAVFIKVQDILLKR
mmetsp:Transcript_4820/g.5322  ORF Transcript_4820/g.5322 Transcript_4820/m.5322 type:complete len:256 (-) Transcript_4820:102-869(-)